MSLNFAEVTTEEFRRAVAKLERAIALREAIAALKAELAAIGGTAPTRAPASTPSAGKRRLSAKGRAAISAAARKRWAQARAEKAPKSPAKPKRKMSPAARKRMAEVAKARWAKARAEGRTTLAAK